MNAKKSMDSYKPGEIYSITGRKLIDYDWKYGMKHVPVWKTNQLLDNQLYDVHQVESKEKAKEKERLKLIAKRANIYQHKNNGLISNENRLTQHRKSRSKFANTTYNRLPIVSKIYNSDLNTSFYTPDAR